MTLPIEECNRTDWGLQNIPHTTTTMTTNTPSRRIRFAAAFAVAALLLAACSSGDDNTIRLGDGGDGLTPGEVDTSGAGAGTEGEPVAFTYDSFDGERVEFADLSDKPVVVNFFASWCPSCIAEMPDFETVYQDLNDEVEFLGLAMQDRRESAINLVDETGITYPVGIDQNGEVFALFNGLGMPTTVLISADGAVAKVHSGQLDAEALSELITDELLS